VTVAPPDVVAMAQIAPDVRQPLANTHHAVVQTLNQDGSIHRSGQDHPYDYVDIRGRAPGTTKRTDGHIDRLAKRFLDADSYLGRTPGEQRTSYFVEPERVRHRRA
jgi:hypothetical protein